MEKKKFIFVNRETSSTCFVYAFNVLDAFKALKEKLDAQNAIRDEYAFVGDCGIYNIIPCLYYDSDCWMLLDDYYY